MSQGREEIVDRIKRYLTGPSAEPFILWGYSGCGKTSLLAKGYSQVRAVMSVILKFNVCALMFAAVEKFPVSYFPS